MTKKIIVIGPEATKESASCLAEWLDADYHMVSKTEESTSYVKYPLVINYGSSRPIDYNDIVNTPKAVKLCVNKISTLKRVVHGVEWTKDRDTALDWLNKDGAVVCRDREEGSQSEGVMIAMNEEGFAECPAKFWTKYFEHKHEARVNVYKGKILSVYEKITKNGFFDFRHLEINGEHKQVDEMIESIQKNIGIDFYGIDVLVNEKGEARLLEVNSGASLMDETLTALLPEIKKEISKHA